MFTGIIHHTGIVEHFDMTPGGARLVIRHAFEDALERGESVAVNGVCLTALPESPSTFAADLSEETLNRSTLRYLTEGRRVNLERALALGDRMGGHLVQGHVDGMGLLVSVEHRADFADYRFRYPIESRDLVVDKGSIAIDGISLTIVEPVEDEFTVAIIPETLARTMLVDLSPGDPVNIEFDVMARYARNLFARYVVREET